MESIAFEIKFNTDAMQASGIQLKRIILSGGASQNGPLCQIIADVLQREIFVSFEAEASSRGVFYLVKDSMLANEVVDMKSENHQPEYDKLLPDLSKGKIYQSVYERFLRLGDMLEQLNF